MLVRLSASRLRVWLVALVVLNIGDALMTAYALNVYGGMVYETIPLTAAVWHIAGIAGLLAQKAIVLALVSLVLWYADRHIEPVWCLVYRVVVVSASALMVANGAYWLMLVFQYSH